MSTIVSESENFIVVDLGELEPKTFKQSEDKPAPSRGWFGNEKLALESGMYQCNWQVTLVGSNMDVHAKEPTAPFKAGQQALARKEFKSGSRGYYAQGNVLSPHGKVHMQFQMVLIGSKPESISAAEDKLAKQEAALAAQAAKLADRRKGLEALKASVA